MSFNPGEQVGPYRIMEQLGQGGMATVYKAYHPALDRYVAIKVLHQAFLEDPNFHSRFQREARVVAKLEHPNIVPIHDYAEHEKRPYLVMRFIEGETLKARLQRGPLSPGEIERIIEAVGAALSYAHQQGVLHRDVKPSNVMLAKDGQIYLADFGLARIAQSGESTLTSDMIVGTPQYISPEQAMAKKDLDQGTDIYSFGVMIYEMVVGSVPFSADTPFSVIHDHIYTALPLPSKVNPNISPNVERVLLKALAKDRSDRYPDIAGMVQAFKEAWESQKETVIRPSLSVSDSQAATIAAAGTGVSAPVTVVSEPVSEPVPEPVPGPVAEPVSEPVPGLVPESVQEIRKPGRRPALVWIGSALAIVFVIALAFALLRGSIPGTIQTAMGNPTTPTSRPTATVVRPTNTKAPVYPPGVLFLANFNDGQKPADWDTQSNWAVKEGAWCGSGHFFTGAIKGDNWKDYSVKLRLRLDSGTIHLNLRQSSATGGFNRYFFTVDQTGLGLNKQFGEKFINDLAGLNVPFALHQWTDIGLVAQGNRVMMLVNGVIVIDRTDVDQPIGMGTFSLETLDASIACVDDILISDLGGKPPFDVLYEQHFDTDQSLAGWGRADAGGNPNTVWQIRDGALCGNGHNWATFDDMKLTDFAVKYRLTLKNGAIHLNSRLSEGSRYYTWIGVGDPIANLSKDTPQKAGVLLTTGPVKILPNQGNDLKLNIIGGHIQFWVNGKLVHDVTDKTPLGSGTIGFEALETDSVCMDDFIITLPSLMQTP